MQNSFIKLVASRHSVRKFQSRRVDRKVLKKCVEAARLAPSAENSQPWRFIIVDNENIKSSIVKHAFGGVFIPTKWAGNAPVLVVLCAQSDILANRIGKQITGIQYYLIDVGIAGEHFVLEAQEQGLGTCWIGWFSQKGVRKALNLPRKYKPIALFAVGYPAKIAQKTKKRKELDEICFFNSTEI